MCASSMEIPSVQSLKTLSNSHCSSMHVDRRTKSALYRVPNMPKMLLHPLLLFRTELVQSYRACQESQVQKDFQAQEECLVRLVPRGYQVEMVVLEKEDSKERGENLDLQEAEASRVLQ